jgi:hypothetical protein
MEDGVVAERFGAKRVLADSLQDAAEGRVRRPQQQQEGGREDGGVKVVNQILPVITTPRALSLTRLGPSGSNLTLGARA